MVNPGFLDDLRADAAAAATDMNSAYGEYVRLRGRCNRAQRSHAKRPMLSDAGSGAAPERGCRCCSGDASRRSWADRAASCL